jgi:hypothetical protein
MSAPTLAPAARRHAVLFSTGNLGGSEPRMFKKTEGGKTTLILEDVPVFRSGQFRDSMGYQHSWESLHMTQMVTHYEMLRDRQIFAEVPVRDGHPGFLLSGIEGNGKVVGWHTALRTEDRVNPSDGQTYTYLLASYEILDPNAITAIESGLWRNRSSEIGAYLTNTEAEFWPVYQGFAYVDIPAVEGLNGFSKTNPGLGISFSLMIEESDKEPTVAVKKHNAAGDPAVDTSDDLAGTGGDDEGTGEVETIEVADDGTVLVNGEPEGDPAGEGEPEGDPAGEEPVEEPVVSTNSKGTKGAFAFKVHGKTVRDFAAVQAHIDVLEATLQESTEANRKAFVKSLENDKKITAAQREGLEAFALTLTPEQYDNWCAGYAVAPVVPLLAQHAASVGNSEGQNDDDAIEIAREIVANHKRGGMSTDAIKSSQSYKTLIAHDPTFTL